MDIPLPDDPPPPLKKSQSLGIELPATKTKLIPLEIGLSAAKIEPTTISSEKSSGLSENIKLSDTSVIVQSIPTENDKIVDETIASEANPTNISLEIKLPPVNNVSSKSTIDFVYSPSASEPSQLEIELPSPFNSGSVDNDLSSSQAALEIDLPPSSINLAESDSQSSKFMPRDFDPVIHPDEHFAPSIEGNSSSKFPWNIEPPNTKETWKAMPSEAEIPQPRNLSPWEIDLPTDNEKLNTFVTESKSFSEVKTSLMNISTIEMDIPMPDDPNDPNRYSPSLPVDDEPPLEIVPPQPKGVRSLELSAPPLPPLPALTGSTSTVLGRTKAKKRLMAFSMTKQGGGAGLSFALSKKPPPVNKDAVKVFDDKGEEGKKKGLKKGQSVDKARDTISEIEELKRKEMMLLENMQILHPRWGNRDSHLYPMAGMLPIPELVDAKKTEELESLVGELLAKKEKKKDDRRSGSEEKERHRSSKSKRSERDRDRDRRKRRPKTLPLDWKEFKKDGHKVHHFRRFKFEVSKLEAKEKRRHRRGSRDRDRRSRSKDRDKKDNKSSSTQPPSGRINLLETPMEIRKVLVVLTTRGDDVEFPEFLVKYTKLRPQLAYCENPRFATYHFMNRKEMLATVPHDIEEIIFKFLNSIRPKRLKVKTETKELEEKSDDEVKGDLTESDDKIESVTKNESDKSEEYKNSEIKSDLLDVLEESGSKTNKDEKLIESEEKTENKRCKKLHRDWFVPWKTCQMIPQYLTQDEDEIEIEEILQSTIVSADVNTLSEMKVGEGDVGENVYPSRKRNISKSSDSAVITEELEPIIRTAIRSKWDSDYEDSQDGFSTEKKNDIPVEKDLTPVTNVMEASVENVTSELEDDNLGVVPMDIVEDKPEELENLDHSLVDEPEELEPPNVVEKLVSEYEEFMKMVSFENKKDEKSVDDMDEVQDEYENSVSDKLNESMESNINKRQSFAEYLAEIGVVGNSKENQSEEDGGAQIDMDFWETKKLYFNRSRSDSLEESDISDKENDSSKKGKLSEKDKVMKKKNKKKKVQASKIKKKSKDKRNKKKKKKYSSSESSSSSSSSSDYSSDDSSSSDSSSSSSNSSSDSSSSSSSESSVDRKKLRKKKKADKLKDKAKNKKNRKSQSSSEDEDEDDDEDDKRKKDKKKKKKKVEKKKKLKADKVKKLKDKKTKKKRSRDSSEEVESPSKKVKKNRKNKKKEDISNLEDPVKKKGKKKLDEEKHKEIELPPTKSLKRLSHVKEESDVPKKKVRPEKDLSFENVSDADIGRFFDMQYMEKSKEESTKFEVEIDEDFKKSKEYRRMKKRGLDVDDVDSLTREFEPNKSKVLAKKSSLLLQEDLSDDFEESHSKSKQYFFQVENRLTKASKEKSKQDFELFDSSDGNIQKQHTEDIQRITKLVKGDDTEADNLSRLEKDVTPKVCKIEVKEDEDDQSSKTSSKNKKKEKKEKKKKEIDGSKERKKKRKKSKNSPKQNFSDSKDEEDSVENHIHFLRDENFLFELGKQKTGIGGGKELRKDFDEKLSDNDSSLDKNLNCSKLKNDSGLKSNGENSNGSSQPRNLEWHDDSETRASFIRRLQSVTDNKNIINALNSDLLGILYRKEDDENSSLKNTVDASDNSKSLNNKRDTEVKLYNEYPKKKLLSSPLGQFPSFNIDSVAESDEDSINKENNENRFPSPDSSLGDIEIESQDNSFVLEKDLPIEKDIDIPESSVKKGVFSEVSVKEKDCDKSIPDNFRLQEETFKTGTNDSDRYSPTLDLDLMSPTSLTGEDKVGSDMSLDSNELEDSFGDHKKSLDVLNMLDIPLPPPAIPSLVTTSNPPKESTWNPPIPCPAPVPPPLLRPHLVATSPSFKNILNIPSEPLLIPQVETKFPEPQLNLIRKEPIRLPLTNTRLTLNKPLVKVKPANIFDDDDDEEEDGNSLSKNLIDSPEKEVQVSSAESESKFDESKKKRSRWGMEPEDELPIVKLYLASEVVKQTSSIDDANCSESQTSKEISDDISLFDKGKSVVSKKKFEDSNQIENQIVNEERDVQSIDVSNIEVENAQEAWKDQENFNAIQEEQNSGSIEVPRNVDLNKISISDNIIDSITTVKNEMMETKGDPSLDARVMDNLNKLPEEHITEEIRHDSRHDKSRNKSDESYRKRDYSEDRSRSSRRRDSSRDRRRRRDSSRDRRDYSRKDRSRSKEHRRDRSRDRYRRDSPDRKDKKRDRSRERRRRDSPRDRKREKSPRRRDESRESYRKREESPRRRGDIRESPKRKDDTKESPRRSDLKEQKPLMVPDIPPESETETSENEEGDCNVEEFISNIKEEPIDKGYEIMKENIDNKKEQVGILSKVESVETKEAETINNIEELPPQPRIQKIKINFKNPQPKTNPIPRKASPLGFKRSLADSTSDSELIPVKKLIRTSVCLSPKRLSLDDRIELELGVKKSPPPPPAPQIPLHQTYYQIPVHDGSQLTPPVLPVPQQRRVPTTLVQPPRVDWDAEVFAPTGRLPPVLPVKSQVLQVGNILQVVPTEMSVPTPTTPSPVPIPVAAPIVPQDNLHQLTSKVLQIGNMIQVVPTAPVPTLTPAQIFANAIANAVASVASSSPNLAKVDPTPVVKPTLPVAPVQPTVSLPPSSPEEQLPAHTSPLLLPLPVAKKAINLTPVTVFTEGGDTRRLEKEKRKREKEMRRQQKQKKATKKMIREALLMKEALESSDMENDDVRISEDEATDEEEVAPPQPDVLTTPVRNKFFSPLPPPPSKGILVSPGFREKPVLATKPVETRKVSFADGVHPGEGTSPSASEEHPHSPPPQASNPKDKRYKKKKKKRKVKVRIIRVEEGDDDDDEDDDGSPPPPPPGSPPPMFHYPPPPPGFMYAPPPSFTVLQGGGDGQTFAPVYQQHHSSTTTTHTTTVQFAPPPPPPLSKHARK